MCPYRLGLDLECAHGQDLQLGKTYKEPMGKYTVGMVSVLNCKFIDLREISKDDISLPSQS